MAARWDGDIRGHGIGHARRLAAGAAELVTAFDEPDWVAEEPEVHLLPHVRAWCERDRRVVLTSTAGDGSGAYIIELQWQGSRGEIGQARAAIYALIGRVAESATYVRQRSVTSEVGGAARLRFEVGTGELGADTAFAPHGHVLVIDVAGVA